MFAKDLNTPEPVLREMYWYDIMLMADTYNEMMENAEEENNVNNDILAKQHEISEQYSPGSFKVPSFSTPSLPNIGTITSGFKI